MRLVRACPEAGERRRGRRGAGPRDRTGTRAHAPLQELGGNARREIFPPPHPPNPPPSSLIRSPAPLPPWFCAPRNPTVGLQPSMQAGVLSATFSSSQNFPTHSRRPTNTEGGRTRQEGSPSRTGTVQAERGAQRPPEARGCWAQCTPQPEPGRGPRAVPGAGYAYEKGTSERTTASTGLRQMQTRGPSGPAGRAMAAQPQTCPGQPSREGAG